MFYVKRPFLPRKTALLIQTIKSCAAFQTCVLVVFTQSSQKQAPHDLQTYIFSGENDLLHDVHFIIITAFS